MRRLLLMLAMIAIAAPACATAERPEGIVERWLISLNQGAAGDPDRYAPPDLSETAVPGWRDLEPGELDVIEVGGSRRGSGGTILVPFQLERRDGVVARAFAVMERRAGSLRIIGFRPPPDSGPAADPPFARRSTDGAGPAEWLAAVGVSVGLILLTVALMRLVPERAPDLRTRPEG